MNRMHLAISLAALAMAAPAMPTPALAAPAVALASDVFVEHAGDASRRVIEPASQLRPGDRVVTVVTWKRVGSGGEFVVTNPLPRAVQFEEASGSEEVSVDGGHRWGRLGALRIGARLATAEDVTHLRWRVTTPAPQGRIAYSAIVR